MWNRKMVILNKLGRGKKLTAFEPWQGKTRGGGATGGPHRGAVNRCFTKKNQGRKKNKNDPSKTPTKGRGGEAKSLHYLYDKIGRKVLSKTKS